LIQTSNSFTVKSVKMRLSVLVSLLPFAVASPTHRRAEPAPLHVPTTETSNLIADKYIVKFKKDSPLAVLHDAVKELKSKPHQVFENALTGFVGKLDKAALEVLRYHPDVRLIRALPRCD